ncbi:nuclear transport factor 2 family protein [Lyngbya aestuarii]|uniref:nuclear transport factor 2 family protein n=1 Tax=Lyngbya aestuarii TaxID=118322 RepID=UPI00403DD2E0
MRNRVTSLQRLCQSFASVAKSCSLDLSVFFVITLGLTGGWVIKAQAESPETAPPQIKDILTQIDAAANKQDLEEVMDFYGTNFRNSDGLTPTSMEQALTQLWKRYPQLNYRTELTSWEQEGNGIVTETVTYITSNPSGDSPEMKLESTLRSRQRFEDQKIVEQKILAERTQLSSGENPPTVEVQLPEQVGIGQKYNFDVIVEEPLGNDLLLGTALEEPVGTEGYSKPANFDLELLPAGGIFKMGKAPMTEGGRWVSAVLIRRDGITTVIQRLPVVEGSPAATKPSN